MFQFSLVKLILASNYFVFSCASAEMGAGSDPGFMTMPIRCRASCAALTLAFALLLPAAANAQNAYITNYNASTVSVIETATNTVTATIPVGRGPDGVAVTPGGAKAYIANQIDGTVSVIDTATNTVTATIPNTVGGYRPDGIAVSPDGAKVYVTGQNSSDSDNTVSVIATASNAVVARIPVGNIPIGVAVSPDGAKVYVTNQNSGSVSVIAAASNTVVATIPVGAFPFGVAVTPDGAQAMVANYGSGTVSVIATATNTVVATIPVGNGTWGVAVTPDGAKAYVTNRNSDTVSVIATASNTVVATIRVGNGPWGVAVTPNGADAYVANSNDNTVSVIATATNAVATTISGINQPLAFGKFIGGPVHGSPPVAVNETKTTRINSPVLVDFSAGASRNPTSAAIVSPPGAWHARPYFRNPRHFHAEPLLRGQGQFYLQALKRLRPVQHRDRDYHRRRHANRRQCSSNYGPKCPGLDQSSGGRMRQPDLCRTCRHAGWRDGHGLSRNDGHLHASNRFHRHGKLPIHARQRFRPLHPRHRHYHGRKRIAACRSASKQDNKGGRGCHNRFEQQRDR